MTSRRSLFLATAMLVMAPSIAMASDFPDKPVRLIVPFPPGGTADIVARLVSDKMGQALGVPVVVDNRAGGAGGGVGTVEIRRAKADGYTIGIATVGTLGTAPAVSQKPLYDPAQDFSYISNLGQTPMILAVGSKVSVKGVKDLVELAKSDKTLTFATGGTGGVAHLMGAKFQIAAGAKISHVPYRGASPAMTDVAGGQVDMLFDALTSSAGFINSGKLRPLAVSGAQRVALLPNVPTFEELGLGSVSTPAWYGLIAPAGVPGDVLAKLNDAVIKALSDAEVKARFAKLETEVIGSTPQAFRQQVLKELNQWRQLAASQNISLD